jgi:hypothetical protein
LFGWPFSKLWNVVSREEEEEEEVRKAGTIDPTARQGKWFQFR